MNLPIVYTVPAFSLVYTRDEIPGIFVSLKNERESVGKTALNQG